MSDINWLFGDSSLSLKHCGSECRLALGEGVDSCGCSMPMKCPHSRMSLQKQQLLYLPIKYMRVRAGRCALASPLCFLASRISPVIIISVLPRAEFSWKGVDQLQIVLKQGFDQSCEPESEYTLYSSCATVSVSGICVFFKLMLELNLTLCSVLRIFNMGGAKIKEPKTKKQNPNAPVQEISQVFSPLCSSPII